MLAGLILRGVAFEYRLKKSGSECWDLHLSHSSIASNGMRKVFGPNLMARSFRLPPYRIVGSNSESAGRVPDTADMAGKQLSTQDDQSSRRARHRAIHAEDG
jgi:hypothetical protein